MLFSGIVCCYFNDILVVVVLVESIEKIITISNGKREKASGNGS